MEVVVYEKIFLKEETSTSAYTKEILKTNWKEDKGDLLFRIRQQQNLTKQWTLYRADLCERLMMSLVNIREMAEPSTGPSMTFTNDWPVCVKTSHHGSLLHDCSLRLLSTASSMTMA